MSLFINVVILYILIQWILYASFHITFLLLTKQKQQKSTTENKPKTNKQKKRTQKTMNPICITSMPNGISKMLFTLIIYILINYYFNENINRGYFSGEKIT